MQNIPDSSPALSTSAADAPALATLMLSRGKYFVASKVDKSITPEAGQAPFSVNFVGLVRDQTADSRFFLVEIYGVAEDFDNPAADVVGQRVMTLDELRNATFFPSFSEIQNQAAVNTGLYESLNIV